MKDLVSAIFDVHKLPFKVLLWLALVSGVLVVSPAAFRTKLGLDPFMKDYGSFVGFAFLSFGSLAAINTIGWAFGKTRAWVTQRKRRARIRSAMGRLDHAEKAVLREFFIQSQHTIELPFNDAVVVGLINNGILDLQGEYARRSLAGIMLLFSISPSASRLVTYEAVDLPQDPSAADKERIFRARPGFAHDVQRHKDLLRW
jgi:hypothetical protein